jgi:hypothetical protein
MPTIERPAFTFSFTLLLLLAALACFGFALLVVEGVVNDFGVWQEWIAGGLIFSTLARIF